MPLADKRDTILNLLVGEQQIGLSPAVQLNPFTVLALTCTVPFPVYTQGAHRFAFSNFIIQALTPHLLYYTCCVYLLCVAKKCI